GLMTLGTESEPHVVGTALICIVAVGCSLPWLLPSAASRGSAAPVFARPTGVLLRLGALAFCGLLTEGAMGDWSTVYLHDTLGSSSATAAAGFAAFSLAMAAGRFTGDPLVSRYGPTHVLRVSGSTAALGLTLALLAGVPAAGVIGVGVGRLGIA